MSDSYPWTQYLEYPLLVLQNFLLLLLLGLTTSSMGFSTGTITLYSGAIAAMAGGAVPRHLILLAMVTPSPPPLILTPPQSITIPLGLSSKLAQILAMRTEGSSSNVSAVAWVINGVTGMARLYTHLHSKVSCGIWQGRRDKKCTFAASWPNTTNDTTVMKILHTRDT